MRFPALLATLVLAAGTAHAQADEAVSFEAVSIKPFPEGTPIQFSGCQGGPGGGDPARIDCQYITLKTLVMRAYQLKSQEVFGPAWIDDAHFNVLAKPPAGAAKDQVPAMFRRMLAERFHLEAHRENRMLNVYALTVAKNGLRIKQSSAAPSAAEDAPSGPPRRGEDGFPVLRPSVYAGGPIILYQPGKARLLAGNTTMTQLAETFSGQADRIVVDQTGLSGKYDLRLDWMVEAGERGSRPGAETSPGPNLFAAVEEQLGLKLAPVKLERPVLVVDRAEKQPTEN